MGSVQLFGLRKAGKDNDAFVTISVPHNTSFFMLNGTIGLGPGEAISMTMLKVQIGPNENIPSWISSPYQVHNAVYNRQVSYNVPLFFTPLDPRLEYTVTMMPVFDYDSGAGTVLPVMIERITFYSSLS
jgi:hypothetical protein